MKLANEEYCRELIATRATICFAYDNDNPETYRVHRGNAKILDAKLKALENIGKIGGAKVVLMSLIAKGYNDERVPELIQFCHERRSFIRAIDFMPLAHTWDSEKVKIEADRITTEDVEQMVDQSFPEDKVEFLPASFIGQTPTLMKALHVPALPFAGAHPNCESMYLLVSDGEQYVPLSRYLKTSILDVARGMLGVEEKLSRRWRGRDPEKLRKNKLAMFRVYLSVTGLVLRHVRLSRLFKGRGIGRGVHAVRFLLELVMGRKFRHVLERHTAAQGILQLIVLPFEDSSNIETHRLERCPTGFAIVDPVDDRVKHVPTCAWGLYKNQAMSDIMKKYSGEELRDDIEPIDSPAPGCPSQ
jgi:uncharacterized radical SAM superfamily Fe-S cluster-containing enzyme